MKKMIFMLVIALAGCQAINKLDVTTTTTTGGDGTVVVVKKDVSTYSDYGMYAAHAGDKTDSKAEVIKGLAAAAASSDPAVASGGTVGLVAIGASAGGGAGDSGKGIAPPQKDEIAHEVASTFRWAASEKFANDRAARAADVAIHASDNALKAAESQNTMIGDLAGSGGPSTSTTTTITNNGDSNASNIGSGALNDGTGAAGGNYADQHNTDQTAGSKVCWPAASGVPGNCF